MSTPRLLRRASIALIVSLTASVLALFAVVSPASAAPPNYVVAGDDPTSTGDAWGLHEAYFNDLRAVLTNPANFGASGIVHATYSIGTPRAVPLTPNSLNGIDVYFLSARDLVQSDVTEMTRFRAAGGAIVVNSNGPDLFNDTDWLNLTLSPRVIFGDKTGSTTHRSPSPSHVASDQANHPIMSGPFGTVTTFDNWHSVAGFTATPGATVLSRITVSGPPTNAASPPPDITLSNYATLAVYPVNSFSVGSGPVIATSDVDTFSNAYSLSGVGFATGPDLTNTLTGTGNGVLARNAFAWIAAQKAASGFTSLATPARVLDTRSNGGPLGTGAQRQLSFTSAGVPTDADMVAVNITAVDPTATGYLTAWPAGTTVPEVSNVNFVAGTTVANAAFVKLGSGGQISLFNSAGSTQVLVDVTGYISRSGSRLVNLTPTRIKDTRGGLGGTGIAHAATTQALRVAGSGGVPVGATAVVLNVTAVDPTATSFVTVWPGDQSQPTVSNINTRSGAAVPNLVVVRLPTSGGSAGMISLFNAAGDTHLLVDVLGYFTDASPIGTATADTPHRIIDTRGSKNPLGSGESRVIQTGFSGATAIVLNVTAVDPTATGYLTVYPSDAGKPDASNINFVAGRTSPNLVVVHPASDGTIRVFNSAGSTQLLIDVSARFDG